MPTNWINKGDAGEVLRNKLNQLVNNAHFKGLYATGTALNTAIPSANNGDFAHVAATNTLWYWSSSAFIDSTEGSLDTSFDDALFQVYSNADSTKKLTFDLTDLATATTRDVKPPASDGQLITLEEAANNAQNAGATRLLPNADFSVSLLGSVYAAVTNDDYVLDVWNVQESLSTGVATISKESADAPTRAQVGRYIGQCMEVDITTAEVALDTTEFFNVEGYIEGQDFQQISGREITVSFWHKHTKTGTHCVYFGNDYVLGYRYYVAEYTQSVSNTWEKATITFTHDETGTWDYGTGIGLKIGFCLACGATSQGTVDTWNDGQKYATSNQVDNFDSAANFFKIADIRIGTDQIQTGNETYGQKRQHVSRYIQKYNLNGSGWIYATSGSSRQVGILPHLEPFRGSPAFTQITAPTYTNCSAISANRTIVYTLLKVTVTATGIFNTSGGSFLLDARY